MATVDAYQILHRIHQNSIDSLYCLVGEERYFSDRILKALRHQVILPELREFNEDIFLAHETQGDVVLESLQLKPVMAERRLVILKEAQSFSDKDWAELEAVSALDSDIVFVIQASQLDRRKKTIRRWLDLGTTVECRTPNEASRGPWIQSLAKEKKLELESEALAYLVQMGAQTLEEMDRDLELVHLFFQEPRRLSISDLGQVLQRSREESIFSLSESVGKKDRVQALYLYRRLHAQGESEIALVALLARHIRLLLKCKKALALGFKGASLAEKIGVNSYFLKNYSEQAMVWTVTELGNCLTALAQLDRDLKSSPLASDLLFETFLHFSHRP